jgi:uncharacterized 2Fe-2S/4Fe-4S cluster protein (DUF4445 family)
LTIVIGLDFLQPAIEPVRGRARMPAKPGTADEQNGLAIFNPMDQGPERSMSERIRVELRPLGRVLEVPRGALLQSVLFPHGVEFPCGGRGKCQGCRVRVLSGNLPATEEQEALLGRAALEAGWRLACRCTVYSPLVLDLAQWEVPVLADHTPFAFTPREGYGVAVDLGTTTIAAQLLDLRTGQVLGVETALNLQARHGADIMTRIEMAADPNHGGRLTRIIREQLGEMVGRLIEPVPGASDHLRQIVLVGNTAMHHLFSGLDVKPLAHYPFETASGGPQVFTAADLGWAFASAPVVHFLPCLGGFVGSDILAGILATRLHERADLTVLLDLGTNGEMVVGNRDRLVCASAAAGPAFEGARISMGMRASTGAISAVARQAEALRCQVIGDPTKPRGVCGSGLVDAVAACLDLAWIRPDGRLQDGRRELVLRAPVRLTPSDVRELQLAKGAIAAGTRLLLDRLGTTAAAVKRVFLAGAFGNYINRRSARRIGLFDFAPEVVEPAGNTALLGAKLALFEPDPERSEYARIRPRVEHIGLSSDPRFEDYYIEAMRFPDRATAAGTDAS